MSRNNAGFTLIEILLVMGLAVFMSALLYVPVTDGLRDIRFKAMVAEAQSKINLCLRDNLTQADCTTSVNSNLHPDLSEWNAGGYTITPTGTSNILVLSVDMPAEDSARTFMGVSFDTSGSVTKMVVYPRQISLAPMAYSLHSVADQKNPILTP
ncbi:hypothetical protein A9Q99_13835 [Gammaproteobacteria bacterium 45_16_T64]|nr:hypothetical protein A9Q99_13835 [Gammaproteobacteria bacterium 45_16_T64]